MTTTTNHSPPVTFADLPHLMSLMTGDAKHDQAATSTLDVVVVDNASSTHGWPGGVEARFAVEGWSVSRVSGRDHDALEAAFTVAHPGRPHMVAAVVEPKYSHPAATPTAAAAPQSATTPLAAEAPAATRTAAPTR